MHTCPQLHQSITKQAASPFPVLHSIQMRHTPASVLQSTRRACLATTAAAQTAAPAEVASTAWDQRVVTLKAKNRGCHVVTREVLQQLPELQEYEVGLANLFILHTSAALTINENASPDVPPDLNDALDRIVPEGRHYRHLDEGMDDMPAHVKSSLMGPSLTIPISHGRLALGTWQGIYLTEWRNYGGARSICITMQGCKRTDGRKYA